MKKLLLVFSLIISGSCQASDEQNIDEQSSVEVVNERIFDEKIVSNQQHLSKAEMTAIMLAICSKLEALKQALEDFETVAPSEQQVVLGEILEHALFMRDHCTRYNKSMEKLFNDLIERVYALLEKNEERCSDEKNILD